MAKNVKWTISANESVGISYQELNDRLEVGNL